VTADDEPATTEEGDDEPGAASLPDGLRLRGEVVGVKRVPATAVPETFPADVGTDETLAVEFAFDRYDGRARTYFAAPGDDHGGRLERLLDVHGVSDPAAMTGESVLLDVVDGHPVPVSRERGQRGDDRAVYGVLAGVAPSITIALFSFFGLGDAVFSTVYITLYIVCTFVVLPVSIYLDAWYLRTTTDWEGRPLRWTLLAVLPPLYVVVVPFYLITRENARPLALDPVGTA
jgi:hypothetical protein